MTRRTIRTDGSEELLPNPIGIAEAQRLIGASTLDTVLLRHLGRPLQVMLVDDAGALTDKPVNPRATELYHANCRPGTTWPIRGDVVIVFDEDYADDRI